jgi:hypothetical protein
VFAVTRAGGAVRPELVEVLAALAGDVRERREGGRSDVRKDD